MKLKKTSGITLTEVMVSTVIFTFIMAGLYTTLMAGRVSWQSYDAAVRAQREARRSVQNMARDFRVAENVLVSATANGLTVAFTHPDEGTVNYTWETVGGSANQILRQTTSATRILAQNISNLSITSSPNDVVMDVTSTVAAVQGQSNSFSLSKKVAKR